VDVAITLDDALAATRTGDVWVFRGVSVADRAIQAVTNAPVNHVGMSVVLEDLPPLMWHAELGRSLPDLWTGEHQRGVQLHDARDAVLTWAGTYGQQPWLRQLEHEVSAEQEAAVLRSIARLSGTPFPRTAKLAGRWLAGRLPGPGRQRDAALETAFCAEVVGLTYEAMGLLERDRRAGWYDPGRFWSGDELALVGGARLGDEIEVVVPSLALS
jgi:hypothetical protein